MSIELCTQKMCFFVLLNKKDNTMDNANLRIIIDLKNFLMQIHTYTELWDKSVISGSAFTRKRSLPFVTLVLMILNLPKRSLTKVEEARVQCEEEEGSEDGKEM